MAVYVSAHGHGHAVRTATFLERLLRRLEFDLDVTTPPGTTPWPDTLRKRTRSWRELKSDAGVMQADELCVDRDATSVALEVWDREYEQRIEEEALRLRGATAVLGDVPPLAFAAADRASLPSFALANFSWDWIYGRMGFEQAARRAAEAYRSAAVLFELEPAAPMTSFPRKLSAGVLGRAPRADREGLRKRLGVGRGDRLVLLAFRDSGMCASPPAVAGIRYVRSQPSHERRNDVITATDVDFFGLLTAADAAVAKAGYGIIGDCAAAGKRLLYVLRDGFPEDEVLGGWLERRAANRRIDSDRLRDGTWGEQLEKLLREPAPAGESQERVSGALEVLAAALR